MILPVQMSAARILLGITQKDLAERANVGLGTIKRIEAARYEFAGTAQTISRIQRALEAAGIVFIDQNDEQGPGVRLKKPLP